jgi:hypothetical protein
MGDGQHRSWCEEAPQNGQLLAGTLAREESYSILDVVCQVKEKPRKLHSMIVIEGSKIGAT